MENEKLLIDANDVYSLFDINGFARLHLSDIDTIPRVDAVEVAHGYTIPADEPKKVLLDRKCVKCDNLMLSTDAYCPICGARMDGGDGNG